MNNRLFKYFFTLIISSIILSKFISCSNSKFSAVDCDYNNPAENSLCEENNIVNIAMTEKDWKTIHDLKLNAKNNNIGWVDNYKDFRSALEKKYFWAILNVKMISISVNEDHGETYNIREGKFLLWPFKTKLDTVIHKWKYKDNKWYLYEWDRGIKDPPDNWDKNLMKEIDEKLNQSR